MLSKNSNLATVNNTTVKVILENELHLPELLLDRRVQKISFFEHQKDQVLQQEAQERANLPLRSSSSPLLEINSSKDNAEQDDQVFYVNQRQQDSRQIIDSCEQKTTHVFINSSSIAQAASNAPQQVLVALHKLIKLCVALNKKLMILMLSFGLIRYGSVTV